MEGNETVATEVESPTLFRTEDPDEIIKRATALATTLAAVLSQQKLTARVGSGEHVLVEGWTLLGTMLGVFPVCVWTKRMTDPEGWEARVEVRARDGAVLGAAEAECLRSERHWKNRDDYALRSMAQTRATSKALRQPLGFIVSLAGFNPTPAEEMPPDNGEAVQHVEGPSTTPTAPELVSDIQRKMLFKAAREIGLSGDELKGIVEGVTGQPSTAALTQEQFKALMKEFEHGPDGDDEQLGLA